VGILFPYHPMPLRFRCSSSGIGIWAYRAVFAATAAGYMGIPIIGTAATGAVAGPAGRLNPGISRGCCPRFT